MLPLETKQSRGKLIPHSDLREGAFLGEALRRIQREMKLGTWNNRSLYRADSLKAAVRELVRYQLDVVGVQVRWDKGGTVRAGDYNLITRRWDVGMWTGLGWPRIETGGGRL